MFDDIQRGLSGAFDRFKARGKLTEANMKEGLREVRTALLEADVNYEVVQRFMKRVTETATGQQLIKSVRPDQQIVKIVHDELVQLMGEGDPSIRFEKTGPTVLMLCGLQGSGKTTTCGKLARRLMGLGRKPLLVAADLQRPAAIEQLRVLGEQLGVPVHSEDPEGADPVEVCKRGVAEADKSSRDTVILDTAGRLHVDDELMDQLKRIERKVKPHQVYFVCDALTGQDAVASAGSFNDALELDGVIMTKLDGDARGGAALSVRQVTGVPIKFVGMGEKLERLDPFDPERLVGQMLGMGDIVGLVEAAKQVVDEQEALRQQERMAKGKYDLNDFRSQLAQMKQIGSVKDLIGKIPGMNQMEKSFEGVDADGEMKRIGGIIDSMTPDERRDPHKIDISRRRRIASGSGVEPHDVSSLVKQFDGMASVMKQMSSMSMMDRVKALGSMGKAGAFNPGAVLKAPKQGTGKRLSAKEREKQKKLREKEARRLQRELREKRKGK